MIVGGSIELLTAGESGLWKPGKRGCDVYDGDGAVIAWWITEGPALNRVTETTCGHQANVVQPFTNILREYVYGTD